MDLCMGIEPGMRDLQDHGRGLNNSVDHNVYCAAPFYSASLGVKAENLYEFPMDAIHLLRQNLAANDNNSCLGYSCLPWHQVVNHPAALVLCDPVWQRHLLIEQRREFESPPDSAKQQIKGEMPAELSTFEERQVVLVAEVLGRGMSCNRNEIVEEQEQAPVHALLPSCWELVKHSGEPAVSAVSQTGLRLGGVSEHCSTSQENKSANPAITHVKISLDPCAMQKLQKCLSLAGVNICSPQARNGERLRRNKAE